MDFLSENREHAILVNSIRYNLEKLLDRLDGMYLASRATGDKALWDGVITDHLGSIARAIDDETGRVNMSERHLSSSLRRRYTEARS